MMKIVILLLCSLTLWSSTTPALPFVSTKSFSGLWYEIARTYNDYEKNCVAATVEYTLVNSNKYDVTNRCFENVIGGELIVYRGSGKTFENNLASKLKLTYFWVFSREYHIIHWEENYAVMSSPDYQNLWIMSRTPSMPKAKLQAILAKLNPLMDIKHLIFTPQDPKGRYQ